MNSWIEEAEKRELLKKSRVTKETSLNFGVLKINDSKIQEFITSLKTVVERVKKIPVESRTPSNELGFTHLQDEYKYDFYGSANFEKSKTILFITLWKYRTTFWRRISFELSDREDIIKIVLSEKAYAMPSNKKLKKIKSKYLVNLNMLNQEIIDNSVNWLVFRLTNREFIHSLPINSKSSNN